MSNILKRVTRSNVLRCVARTGKNGKFCGKPLRASDGAYCSNYRCQLYAACS